VTGGVNSVFGFATTAAPGCAAATPRGCDGFIEQDKCNDQKQDPHSEPATKSCRYPEGNPDGIRWR